MLQDDAAKGLDAILAKATAITEKAYTMTVNVATKDAEKAIATVEKATKKAADIDTSKATKGAKEQATATKGLSDKIKDMAEQSQKAGNQVGNFFGKLDAGKLIIAGAATAMVAYAKASLEVAESHRLNIDMIRDQLGAQASAAQSFIQAGDQGRGTSSLTRGSLAGYMAMTGYKDEKVIEKNIKNAEKIMASTFGQSLAGFGIGDEKALMQKLSGPIDETSDFGRILKSKMPEFFKAGTLQNMKQSVSRESKFAFQSDEVIEAEARRRLATKAMDKIAGGVTADTDSYRVGMRDFEKSFEKLNAGIGNAVRPAAGVILTLFTAVNRLLSLAPEVPVLIAVVLGLGTAFAAFGAIMPMVTAGVHAFSASLLANPIGMAILAIVALTVVFASLESRFGVFSKAWDHFAQSQIGKDLIEGVKSLLDSLGLLGEGDFFSGLGAAIGKVSDLVAGLFDQIDTIYKMIKGGDVGGALKGGASLMLKLSPLGMVAGFSEALLPSKRVQDMILYVLQKMKDLWDGFLRWMSDIWDVISKILDPIIKLFELVREIKERVFGKGLTESELQKAFEAALKTGSNVGLSGASQEKAAALYGDVSGQKPLTKEEMDRLGITQIERNDAKAIYDKLMAGNAGIGTKGIVDAAAKGAKQGLDDATKEAADNTNKNLADPKYGGSGFAAADWSILSPLKYGWNALTGAAGSVYNSVTKNAIGGEVTKSGLAWVDEKEPIVPAEIARSSVLIERLQEIASGRGGSGGASNPAPNQINVYVTAAPGADGRALGQQIAEAVDQKLSDFEFKRRQEATHNRGNRAFIA